MVFTRVGMMDDYRKRQAAQDSGSSAEKNSNTTGISGYETSERRIYQTHSEKLNEGSIASEMEETLSRVQTTNLDSNFEMTEAGYPAMTIEAAVKHAKQTMEMYYGAGATDPVEYYYGPERGDEESNNGGNSEIVKLASLIQYPINTYAEGQLMIRSQKRDMIRMYGFCIPVCDKPKRINRKKLLGEEVKGTRKNKR